VVILKNNFNYDFKKINLKNIYKIKINTKLIFTSKINEKHVFINKKNYFNFYKIKISNSICVGLNARCRSYLINQVIFLLLLDKK
jgi:hypothetical protein